MFTMMMMMMSYQWKSPATRCDIERNIELVLGSGLDSVYL